MAATEHVVLKTSQKLAANIYLEWVMVLAIVPPVVWKILDARVTFIQLVHVTHEWFDFCPH